MYIYVITKIFSFNWNNILARNRRDHLKLRIQTMIQTSHLSTTRLMMRLQNKSSRITWIGVSSSMVFGEFLTSFWLYHTSISAVYKTAKEAFCILMNLMCSGVV